MNKDTVVFLSYPYFFVFFCAWRRLNYKLFIGTLVFFMVCRYDKAIR